MREVFEDVYKCVLQSKVTFIKVRRRTRTARNEVHFSRSAAGLGSKQLYPAQEQGVLGGKETVAAGQVVHRRGHCFTTSSLNAQRKHMSITSSLPRMDHVNGLSLELREIWNTGLSHSDMAAVCCVSRRWRREAGPGAAAIRALAGPNRHNIIRAAVEALGRLGEHAAPHAGAIVARLEMP
ncbi:hypothetical protein CYMTET_31697, partial [Cymbomonas tetramitiformis]